jgi:hypothetical protein
MRKGRASVRGKRVSKLASQKAPTDPIYGFLAGKGKVVGDIMSFALPWGNSSGADQQIRKSKVVHTIW